MPFIKCFKLTKPIKNVTISNIRALNGKYNFRVIVITIQNDLSVAKANKRGFEFNVQLQYGKHTGCN